MATPAPKILYQLVTEPGINEAPTSVIFGDTTDQNNPVYSDWDVDGNGLIRTVSRQDAMLQTTLKCIFTEQQSSGYGSGIYSFIGMKDVAARRAAVLMGLSVCVMRLKAILNSIAVSQNLSDGDQISTISNIGVAEDADDPKRMNVSLSLQSNDDTVTDIGVF